MAINIGFFQNIRLLGLDKPCFLAGVLQNLYEEVTKYTNFRTNFFFLEGYLLQFPVLIRGQVTIQQNLMIMKRTIFAHLLLFALLPLSLAFGQTQTLEGTATYRDNWAVDGAKVFLLDNVSGAILDSAYTDTTGYFVFPGLNYGDYRVELAATAPAGGIDLLDALLVIHYLAQPPLTPWEPLQLLAADFTEDGNVTMLDASQIIQYWIWQKINGWGTTKYGESEEDIEFMNTEEDTTTLPPDTTVNDTVTGDYSGTKRGDVDGAFEPQKKPSDFQLVRADGSVSGGAGEIIRIPVSLSEGVSVSAMGLGFAFNSEALSLISATSPFKDAIVRVFENKIMLYWVGMNAESRLLAAGDLILEIEAMVNPGSRDHDALVYALPGSQWVDASLKVRDQELVSVPTVEVKSESAMLRDNYPNPAGAYTTFELELPSDARVGYHIYQLNGSRVFSAPVRFFAKGTHAVNLSLDALASGTYMFVIEVDTEGQHQQKISKTFIKD